MRLPSASPFVPSVRILSKTNWEGIGVEPDVKVPADALTTVQKLAAEKLDSK